MAFPRTQIILQLNPAEAAPVPLFVNPPFCAASTPNSATRITIDGMRIGINREQHIFLYGGIDESPVDIQPARMRVDLEHYQVLCTGFNDLLVVNAGNPDG